MSDEELLIRLAQHRTIGAAPHDELAWLVAHGYVHHFEQGELVRKGEPIQSLWVFLSGHFAFYLDRGLGPRKVAEWREGDVSGLLPYSRLTTSIGQGVVLEPSDVFMVDREHLPALIRECPVVTETLVHIMLDRSREFTSSALQDEKMASLGRVAAGLAHELNNPASAAARSAKLLSQTLTEAENTSRAIGAARFTEAQFEAIDRVRLGCVSAAPSALTPIERADREEALAAWLEGHHADPEAAVTLVDTGTTVDALETLAAAVQGEGLDAAVRWIAAGCTIRTLASDIEKAASRVHDLVSAVKRFTFMDRQQSPEPIDLNQGLRDSVALLLHKARRRSVGVTIDVDDNLPPVRAIGSDLNQVWTNLIDNAIDAAPDSGHVEITARRELSFVVVRVVDDGPGIPADIRDRIFDPFFTTKPVGQGTGLGLEIARRLVLRNQGDIDVESRPGRTEFRVSLPVATETVPA
ncbi:MAG TPA: ATP-binding protein [Vicinamibacterales bacterium]